jgi:hypothetical protein
MKEAAAKIVLPVECRLVLQITVLLFNIHVLYLSWHKVYLLSESRL